MKILVTGGAGFIGSHTVDALRMRGDQVAIVDDFNDYYDPQIKLANAKSGGAFLYKGDLCNCAFCEQVLGDFKPQAIIHLAARAGVRPSLANPQLYVEANLKGTLNLMEAMRKQCVDKLVFASSSSVYGNNPKVPFEETDALESIISPYAVTKHAGEQLCKIYASLYGLKITALRFFTVYGPRQRPDLAISKFVRHIYQGIPIELYGDGSTSRDYSYVSDIVDGILSALDQLQPGCWVYNLGGGNPISLRQLVEITEKVVGKTAIKRHLSMQPGDVDRTWAVIDKARRDLGYVPKVSIEDGVRAYYQWWLQQDGPSAG